MFVKMTLKSGRQTYLNSDFIWQVSDADEAGNATVALDLEEGDPYVTVKGTADDVAAALNAAVSAE